MNEHYPECSGLINQLREDVFRILRLLSLQEDFSQQDISGHVNISLGKTNHLLKVLVSKGFVKIKSSISKDQKLKKVCYVLTPKGIDQKAYLTYYYFKLKKQEYFDLKKEVENLISNKAQPFSMVGFRNKIKLNMKNLIFRHNNFWMLILEKRIDCQKKGVL
jgi:EPS-associated MarR family transcriptional regulator